MVNPRRTSINNQNPENQQFSVTTITNWLKKPQSLPILLIIFIFLTWVSLRFQNTSLSQNPRKWSRENDLKANLIRFSSSHFSKDKRGWILNPVSVALDARLSGGAVSCASAHLGEIRPGGMRGNHRHYTCNETFVLWGARIKFRLENSQVVDKGYAEVIIGEDEIAVAGSPSGTAHALVNVDPEFRLEAILRQFDQKSSFALWQQLDWLIAVALTNISSYLTSISTVGHVLMGIVEELPRGYPSVA